MDFKKLKSQALDQAKGLGDKAKEELDKRGGPEGLKTGAKNVAAAAKTGGSPVDKAKAAAAAAKDVVATQPKPAADAQGPTVVAPGAAPTPPPAGLK